MIKHLNYVSMEVRTNIINRFADELKARNIKPGSMAAFKMQYAFLYGVETALNAVGYYLPPAIVVFHSSGRSILDIKPPEAEPSEPIGILDIPGVRVVKEKPVIHNPNGPCFCLRCES